MLGLVRRKATYANVMSTIAVFITLGGASYAAITLPKNSVGSAQLKKNSVTGAKIKKNSVTSLKIKNGSVARADLASAVRAELAKAGAPGPAGAQGVPGLAGAQGSPGSQGNRGPSFGNGRQVSNMNDIPCGVDVVVGSQTVTITEPSRIWVHGQGTLRDDGADTSEYGLWLRLRNAADTATLAVSTRAWDIPDAGDDVMGLISGGIMLTGDDPDSNAPAFEAPAGTYIL